MEELVHRVTSGNLKILGGQAGVKLDTSEPLETILIQQTGTAICTGMVKSEPPHEMIHPSSL